LETVYLDDEVIKREDISGIICLANWFTNKIVIVASTIYPDQDTRYMTNIKLVYCKLPLLEAAKRDTYKQSHLFIDQRQQFMEYWANAFQEPKAPDLTLDTMKSRDMSKKEIIEWYEQNQKN
jgi:adenylylsulfate kinase-like enzyme